MARGLFHDGTEEVIPSGLGDRLNAGIYHPFYNSQGTKKTSDSKFWYDTTLTITSLYDCMLPSNALTNSGSIASGVSGRPEDDGRFYDKAYFESDGGLIFKPTYTEQANQYDLLSGTYSDMVSGDLDMSEDVGVELNTSDFTTNRDGASYTSFYLQYKGESITDKLANKMFRFPFALINTNFEIIKVNSIANSIFSCDSANVTAGIYAPNKSNSLLTQGTSLSNDIIGDPANYHQGLLNHLASGKSANINPLLVGEEGEDYTNFPTVGKCKLSVKCLVSPANAVLLKDSDGTYLGTTSVVDLIANNINMQLTTYKVQLNQYTSKNKPLSQSTPLPIEMVLPKTVASNSHSIYKGSMITNSVTGKVAVGNGSNGLESKSLENSEIVETDIPLLFPLVPLDIKRGETVALSTDFDNIHDVAKVYVANKDTEVPTGLNANNSLSWGTEVSKYPIQTTPKHSAIILDSEVSPTAKSFPTLAVDTNNEYVVQVMGEELISNAGVYDGDNGEFDNLTNGTFIDLNGNTANSFVGFTRTGVFKND